MDDWSRVVAKRRPTLGWVRGVLGCPPGTRHRNTADVCAAFVPPLARNPRSSTWGPLTGAAVPPFQLIMGLPRARPRPLAGKQTPSRRHAFLVTSARTITETTPVRPIGLAGGGHRAPTHHAAELGVTCLFMEGSSNLNVQKPRLEAEALSEACGVPTVRLDHAARVGQPLTERGPEPVEGRTQNPECRLRPSLL